MAKKSDFKLPLEHAITLPPISPVVVRPSTTTAFPGVISGMNSPTRESSRFMSLPTYTTTSAAATDPKWFDGFPVEMLSSVRNIEHRNVNFTQSFVAGAYRDTRLGVTELRAKRIARIGQQRAVVISAQRTVLGRVKRIDNEVRARRDVKRRSAAREQAKIFYQSARLLQCVIRGRIERKRMEALLQEKLEKRQEHQRTVDAAAILKRWFVLHFGPSGLAKRWRQDEFEYSRVGIDDYDDDKEESLMGLTRQVVRTNGVAKSRKSMANVRTGDVVTIMAHKIAARFQTMFRGSIARRSFRKKKNALILLRWFIGKYLERSPLHWRLAAAR